MVFLVHKIIQLVFILKYVVADFEREISVGIVVMDEIRRSCLM